MSTRKPRVIATTMNGEAALVLGSQTFRLADLEAIRTVDDAVALGIPVDYLRPFRGSWPRYWQWWASYSTSRCTARIKAETEERSLGRPVTRDLMKPDTSPKRRDDGDP